MCEQRYPHIAATGTVGLLEVRGLCNPATTMNKDAVGCESVFYPAILGICTLFVLAFSALLRLCLPTTLTWCTGCQAGHCSQGSRTLAMLLQIALHCMYICCFTLGKLQLSQEICLAKSHMSIVSCTTRFSQKASGRSQQAENALATRTQADSH